MSTFDIILLIILGLAVIKGYKRGFIVEIFTFFAFFIGLFLSLELTIPVATELFGSSDYLEFAAIVVFILLFILLSMAIKLGAKALKGVVDMTLFGALDSVAGAIAGLLKWSFILSVMIWVFDSVGTDVEKEYAQQSLFFHYVKPIGPVVFESIGQIIPFIQDMIDSMKDLSGSRRSVITLL